MRDNDKNSCFDLKELTLFVKKELGDTGYDYDEISNHLNICEECSEIVENVKSFYFIETEDIPDFSSSEKSLTLISFKYIFKEKFSLIRSKIGVMFGHFFGSGYSIASGTTISRGSNPVMRFGPTIVLSGVALLLGLSILFNFTSQDIISNDNILTHKEQVNTQQLAFNNPVLDNYYEEFVYSNPILHNYYKGIKNQINQSKHELGKTYLLADPTDDLVGHFVDDLAVDNLVNVRDDGILYAVI